MEDRIKKNTLDILRQEDHERVSVVSHGAAIRQFQRYWVQTSEGGQKSKIGNCCIFKFSVEQDVFTLMKIINHDFSELK